MWAHSKCLIEPVNQCQSYIQVYATRYRKYKIYMHDPHNQNADSMRIGYQIDQYGPSPLINQVTNKQNTNMQNRSHM